jgi:aminoglycoside 6'-N-acetyltransferase I
MAGQVRAGIGVRRAELRDADAVAEMCALLWPEGPAEEHRREFVEKTTSGLSGTLPVAIFVAADTASGALVGFVEVGLRSHADGCDRTHPVGYIEGWFVQAPLRNSGVGAALVHAAENWAREQGCREMASDALIDNDVSQRAHKALGYEAGDRCVHYRKPL